MKNKLKIPPPTPPLEFDNVLLAGVDASTKKKRENLNPNSTR